MSIDLYSIFHVSHFNNLQTFRIVIDLRLTWRFTESLSASYQQLTNISIKAKYPIL
jgi:hypothetical protein